MEAYTGFAAVYDEFMDNIPYAQWAEYVMELLREYGVEGYSDSCNVVDLGCGTGTLSQILYNHGYRVTGIDNSQDMLTIAEGKKTERCHTDSGVLVYSEQDMRSFEVLEPADAIISICDSMNYILEYDELVQVLENVKKALKPGKIFVFDLKTQYYFEQILGDNTFAEDREDAAFIWDNYYYEEEKVNEYRLTLFIKEQDNRFRRMEEYHYQRAYSIQEIKDAIKAAKLETVAVYDAFTKVAPSPESERVYFIVKTD